MGRTVSLFDLTGLPVAFGAVLLVLALALALAPYFPGLDIRMFKVPEFSDQTKKILQFIGPLMLFFGTISFFPFWAEVADGNRSIDTDIQRFAPLPSEGTAAPPPVESVEPVTPVPSPPAVQLDTLNLIVPSRMKDATIYVDGVPAQVFKRTLTTAVLLVPRKQANTTITLEKEGMPTCENIRIISNNQTLTPCQ